MLAESRTYALGGELPVNRIGYGAMRLTGQPGNFGPYSNWEDGKKLLRKAVELGINFFDTARAYGPGHNEALIAEALYPYDGLVIATKGGIDKPAPGDIRAAGSPKSLREHLEESLRHLRVERIDLYQLHRPDPKVEFAQSVQALADFRAEGKIRWVGLSNVSLGQLQEAMRIVPIASVQNRYNALERHDDALIDYCAQHGIAYLPWGPLGAHPMQRGAPLARDQHGLWSANGATATQKALRFLLDRSPNVVVIPGTTTIAHLEENANTWNNPSHTN